MRTWISFLFCSLFLGSCALVHDDAEQLLARGRAPEAMRSLASQERDAAHYPQHRRARYVLYRGLTHMALGDLAQSESWLTEARARWEQDPQCLSIDDAGKLNDAWSSLGKGR